MGVRGLWKILSPAAESRSLQELAVTEGFVRNLSGSRAFRVGVDASLWLYQALHAHKSQHALHGHGPELRTLFYKLARLRRTTSTVVVVFDGPAREVTKRKHQVRGTPHWLEAASQEMVEAFGYTWYRAPAEADAELANLSRLGLIDVVLSGDSDTLTFGALSVLRPSLDGDGDDMQLYNAAAIEHTPGVSLTRGGLMLVAVLNGGDYDEDGLAGCGTVIAQKLAQYGLGDSLLAAAETSTPEELAAFLLTWREDLRTVLRTDPVGHLGQQCSAVADAITARFPDPHIINLYAQPLTTSSNRGPGPPLLQYGEFDIAKLVGICEHRFCWNDVSKTMSHLWEAICLDVLCRASLVPPTVFDQGSFSPAALTKIHSCKVLPTPYRGLTMYSVLANVNPLWDIARQGLRGPAISASHVNQQNSNDIPASSSPTLSTTEKPIRVWVIGPVLRTVLPALVETYSTKDAAKRHKNSRRARTSGGVGKRSQASQPATLHCVASISQTHQSEGDRIIDLTRGAGEDVEGIDTLSEDELEAAFDKFERWARGEIVDLKPPLIFY